MSTENRVNQLEVVEALSNYQVVMEAINIHRNVVRSGIRNIKYDTSEAVLRPSVISPGAEDLVIHSGDFIFSIINAKEGSADSHRVSVNGDSGLISPNMFTELAGLKPDQRIAAGGITVDEVFSALRRFVESYASGASSSTEETMPNNNAEWGKHIAFLLESGQLSANDLADFIKQPVIGLPPSFERGAKVNEPVVTPEKDMAQQEVTLASVHVIESQLLTLSPMTKSTDTLLKSYFQFLTKQLSQNILNPTFPIEFYDGQVASMSQLKQKFQEMVENAQKMVEARGRRNNGPLGDWFWTTSEVPDLGEAFRAMGEKITQVDQILGA